MDLTSVEVVSVGPHLCHGPVKEGGVKESTATNPELPLLRGDEQAACLLLEPSFINKRTLRLTCLFILTQSPLNLPKLLINLRLLKT
jgi:hypothetical protein